MNSKIKLMIQEETKALRASIQDKEKTHILSCLEKASNVSRASMRRDMTPSILLSDLEEILMNDKCCLTTFEHSVLPHVEFIKNILYQINKNSNEEQTVCKIT